MANFAALINSQLNEFFDNGRVEVGLEVGADPGLSQVNYIRIPDVMAVGITHGGKGGTARSPSPTPSVVPGSSSSGKAKASTGVTAAPPKSDASTSDWVMVHEGRYYWAMTTDEVSFTKGQEVLNLKSNKPQSWAEEIRAFVAANSGHVKEDELVEDQVLKAHAIRYWAVKAGFVASSKLREYEAVANPGADALRAVPDSTVRYIAGYAGQALTACVARTASWRKTNHATGGGNDGIASGLPRRWMAKEGMWSTDQDRARASVANRKATTAFYIATHAVSVHNALALTLPTDAHHWCILKATYGLINIWDVKESARLRLAPRTQVAGTAMVTDAVEVVRMLISEGYTPLLSNVGLLRNLRLAHERVSNEGMRAAVYAGWFFNGHPTGVQPTQFNQKSTSYAPLVGELGVIATKFYRGQTISDSPSLANAAGTMASAADQTKWAQLARYKAGTISESTMRAFGRLSGAASGALVESIASDDDTRVRKAVEDYSALLATHAADFHVAVYAQPSADQVIAGKAAADARAEEIARLAV